LADYEDTIKELISIEQGGNYFEPPKILGRESFYQDVKNDALKQITVKFEDTSASTDSDFFLIAWIVYQQFADPQADSAPFLFNKFLDIVAYKYKGDLAGFIAKAGTTWNAAAVRDFFLDNNPTYKNMVTCGGNPTEIYHGLDAGYAVAEFDDVTLNDCTSNCLKHNPTTCKGKTPCAYDTECSGFYYWNAAVSGSVGASGAIASGFKRSESHCILLDTTVSNS
jgi:hypothetical protein